MHRLKSLHGRADLAIVYLLIEHVTEAIDTAPILSSDDKAVELWFPGVLLRAKPQAVWQAQHANSILVKGIPQH